MDIDPTSRIHDCYALCPVCGNFAHLSERQTFCIVCGEQMINACPQCKTWIYYPTARFCPECGKQLTGEKLDRKLDKDLIAKKKTEHKID